jgi:HD-GYP domain-containing protein (c-di-GMP phosphodiesterase class II)
MPEMKDILPGVRHHHERWDGKGYPEQLEGDNIPLMGRLMAVADAFSAMRTDRPYRKALSMDVAMEQLHKGKGTQFDPAMVDAFVAAVEPRLRAEESE